MRRNLLIRYIVNEPARAVIEKHPHFLAHQTLAEAYSQMVLDVCDYKDLLIQHKIGEFQQSQKEKVLRTSHMVGLQPPKLYGQERSEE